eukprot:GHVU01023836.1.p2 GENE.GHVU01023836.1~~GHVU01023836.1.p2  ORF type:complete len:123 (-),score=18.92 GHVU01023836.1:54-422(-)
MRNDEEGCEPHEDGERQDDGAQCARGEELRQVDEAEQETRLDEQDPPAPVPPQSHVAHDECGGTERGERGDGPRVALLCLLRRSARARAVDDEEDEEPRGGGREDRRVKEIPQPRKTLDSDP